MRFRAELRGEIRWRRQSKEIRNWLEQSPWLPPALSSRSEREQLVLSAERIWPSLRLLLTYRSRQELADRGDPEVVAWRRRSLVSLTAQWQPPGAWRARGGWHVAWGDPVDLVSVVSPLPGIVVPRHWGHWRAETQAGLERRWDNLRIQLGGAARQPREGMEGGMRLEVWLRSEVIW
jgi:hypothetical protein